MAATSLRLSDHLKRRIARLVEGTDRTVHSFMVDAIAHAVDREELRRKCGAEAELAEEETERSGKVYDAVEVFSYLEFRAEGKRAKRPRLKSRRHSR